MVLSLRESAAADYAHTTVDPYTIIFNVMKLTIPMFDGSDPGGWISQIERLFDFHQAPEEWRLRLVSYHMEGEAEDWLFWALANNQLRTWPDFRFHFQQQFGCPIFEEKHVQSKPLLVTPSSDCEPVFKRLIEETTARIEDLESKRKKIPPQEDVPIGKKVINCVVKPEVEDGRELLGNMEKACFNLSSSRTGSVRPEQDEMSEKIAATAVITSPVLSVFDKMPESILSSSKEMGACLTLGKPIYDSKVEKEMEIDEKSTTAVADIFEQNNVETVWYFDPGGGSFDVRRLKSRYLEGKPLANVSIHGSLTEILDASVDDIDESGNRMNSLTISATSFTSQDASKILSLSSIVQRILAFSKAQFQRDCLKFRLAARETKFEGYKVEMVVGEDCNLSPPRSIARRRGLSGFILVKKIVGAPSQGSRVQRYSRFQSKRKLRVHLKLVRVGSLSVELMLLDFMLMLLGCFWPFDPGILELIPIIFQPSPSSLSLWPNCFSATLCFRSRRSIETSTMLPIAAAALENSTQGIEVTIMCRHVSVDPRLVIGLLVCLAICFEDSCLQFHK